MYLLCYKLDMLNYNSYFRNLNQCLTSNKKSNKKKKMKMKMKKINRMRINKEIKIKIRRMKIKMGMKIRISRGINKTSKISRNSNRKKNLCLVSNP